MRRNARSKKARFGIGAATVALAPLGAVGFAATKKRKVECITCGTIYDRA